MAKLWLLKTEPSAYSYANLHADGRTTTVPNHAGRNLARPLIREILREIDLTPDRFRQELDR